MRTEGHEHDRIREEKDSKDPALVDGDVASNLLSFLSESRGGV
jgi:hypothetical protein